MFGTAQNFAEPLSIINSAGRVDRRFQRQEIFEKMGRSIAALVILPKLSSAKWILEAIERAAA